ncbi:MAG TPA: hypothetical protein VF808_07515 [Ktedonobacterales bacterium]
MRPMSDIDGEELRWVKPKWSKLTFELRAGEAVVATLNWARKSPPRGEWAGGQYLFDREGWLRPRILIRDASAGEASEPVATFTRRGGALTLSDGRQYRWERPNLWTTKQIWRDSAGVELVRFAPKRGGAEVTVQSEAASLAELSLLLILGQYLLTIAAQEAQAATAATIVPVISG